MPQQPDNSDFERFDITRTGRPEWYEAMRFVRAVRTTSDEEADLLLKDAIAYASYFADISPQEASVRYEQISQQLAMPPDDFQKDIAAYLLRVAKTYGVESRRN